MSTFSITSNNKTQKLTVPQNITDMTKRCGPALVTNGGIYVFTAVSLDL